MINSVSSPELVEQYHHIVESLSRGLACGLSAGLLNKVDQFSKRDGFTTLKSELTVSWVFEQMSNSTADIVGVNGVKVNIILKETSLNFTFIDTLSDVVNKMGSIITENEISVQDRQVLGVLEGSLFSFLTNLNP